MNEWNRKESEGKRKGKRERGMEAEGTSEHEQAYSYACVI